MPRRRDDELDELTAAWSDDERAVVDRLRALPDDTPGADWDALEREIGRAVDAEAARRRPWAWLVRRWRPALGLALVAAAAAIVVGVSREEPAPSRTAHADAGVRAPAPPPAELDDVDDLDDEALDAEVLAELVAAEDVDDGLVPELGLEWIDELDAEELEAVDRWLAHAGEEPGR